MDEAQVRALITESVGTQVDEKLQSFGTDIESKINAAVGGASAALNRSIQKLAAQRQQPTPAKSEGTTPDGKEGDGKGKGDDQSLAIRAEIAQLQKELATQKQSAFEARSGQAVSDAITASGAINPGALSTIVTARFGSQLKEEGGEWYVDDGLTPVKLGDALTNYLQTPEGKHFVPASGVKGAGSKETQPKPTPGNPLSTAAAFDQAFANL